MLKVLAQRGINVDDSYVESTLTEVAEENEQAESADSQALEQGQDEQPELPQE